MVYLKDLVQKTYYSTNGGRDTEVSEVMRPAVFVPDSKPLDALLREMQRDRVHMVLLVDEYGAIAGLVTIEDMLEEIVGEIADDTTPTRSPRWRSWATSIFGCRPGCPSKTLASSTRSSSTRISTSTPSAACWPSSWAVFRCPAPR